MSNALKYFLAAQYVALVGVTLYEGRWREAVYWIGATVITAGVILMAEGEV